MKTKDSTIIERVTHPSEGFFLVSRTSGDEPPCEGAFQVEKLKKDHKRNLVWKKVWAVKINDLNDLIAFVRKYDDTIINIDDNGFTRLEIYDNYRE